MRTTVTLDADVEAALRRAMHDNNISFKQALNDAIRAGLQPHDSGPRSYTIARDLGMPRIDFDKALSVADDLEDADIIRKMRLGK
ncbi:antitoxin [Rarobacter faecitabidus]|uniref:Antitoxin n=1 Tax=Rarobacter faecitabidus TaxID=13243 RepID=A0A542ZWV4_RARFA|nr:antitoxin [Rarobacter faecitabidus]TQL64822.1 hypothetical protein FB461_1345 [Rarobacter faecitabidus]